ncbi:MAG: type II secretion system protein N [Pseudomonadota bacterium]
MKRRLAYILLGATAYGIFLLMMFPASFAYSLFETPLEQKLPEVQLTGVKGRIWDGEVAAVRYKAREVGTLNWQLRPLSLLLGKLSMPLSLQLPDGYLEANLTLPADMTAIHASEVKGQLPVSRIQGMLPYNFISIDGTLALNITEVELDAEGKVKALSGRINWLGAEMSAPQALSFGDLQADLELDEEGSVQAQLRDLGGPLSLDAQFVLQPQGSYSLKGTVAAADGASDTLRQGLGLLGRPGSGGRYPLDFKGRL